MRKSNGSRQRCADKSDRSCAGAALCLYGKDHGVAPAEVARAAGLTPEQVTWGYDDIDKKRATTHYLHERLLLVEVVDKAT